MIDGCEKGDVLHSLHMILIDGNRSLEGLFLGITTPAASLHVNDSRKKIHVLLANNYVWHYIVEAQWLSGRMPDSRSREHRLESPTPWRR